MRKIFYVMTVAILMTSNITIAARIKDLTSIQGVRENHLLGYGLVMGLSNTGDENIYTDLSLRSLLNKYDITVPANRTLNARNVAAVMVEADLPPFAKPGQKIDVTVSSIGSARSLRNGTLVTTALRGEDGNVYAVAQGSLIVSGVAAHGTDGSHISINAPNVGSIPNGATVERVVYSKFRNAPFFTFNLNRDSFITSSRIARVINNRFGKNSAFAIDSRSVKVRAPRNPGSRVDYIAMINNLSVKPGKEVPKVVVNSRTGTVVMTDNVRVSPVAISEGNLVINVSETEIVSQPLPFSKRGKLKIHIKNQDNKQLLVLETSNDNTTNILNKELPQITNLITQSIPKAELILAGNNNDNVNKTLLKKVFKAAKKR